MIMKTSQRFVMSTGGGCVGLCNTSIWLSEDRYHGSRLAGPAPPPPHYTTHDPAQFVSDKSGSLQSSVFSVSLSRTRDTARRGSGTRGQHSSAGAANHEGLFSSDIICHGSMQHLRVSPHHGIEEPCPN